MTRVFSHGFVAGKALEQLVTMNADFTEKFVVCALYTHEIDAISRSLTKLGRTWKIISGRAAGRGQPAV